MSNGRIMVHVTHEASEKIGGIGAVLHGFFTCQSYLNAIERSIIIGPLFSTEGPVSRRLGEDGEVLYSSVDGFVHNTYHDVFRPIERHFNIGIVYGRRTFYDKETGITSCPEVILMDVRHMDKRPVNALKHKMFEEFGIRSDWYENLWEFEQYVRLGAAVIGTLKAINAANESTVIAAHEFMGMPSALAAIVERKSRIKTIFYAHEVATIRRLVEENSGHDTMFYNVLRHAHKNELYVNEVFGDQCCYFKHPLVDASKHCDAICAVGDYTAEELRFLAADFETANINTVYNGIPAYDITLAEKIQSKQKLQQYCESLLGYKPDHIFTHVTRLVPSKGLWRDIRVLEHIEKEFRKTGQTGVMLLLTTEVCQRRSNDIYNMESAYSWPMAHREGWPDMSGGEANFYTLIQKFNAQSRNVKIIFINQFGFSRSACGRKMTEDMEFMDIRKGSDVELGLSIYEPFGISPLEPLTFGGICVCSNISGCAGFVKDVSDNPDDKNVIVADYINMASPPDNIEDLLAINSEDRIEMEEAVSETLSKQICAYLPKNTGDMEKMIESGCRLAKKMSWDVVVSNYLMPAVEEAYANQLKKHECSKVL